MLRCIPQILYYKFLVWCVSEKHKPQMNAYMHSECIVQPIAFSVIFCVVHTYMVLVLVAAVSLPFLLPLLALAVGRGTATE